MTKSEDKLKKILPYMIKREIKIKFTKIKNKQAGFVCTQV